MLVAKLLQLLNFLSLSNDQNPAKSRHRPFEQSLFLFGQSICLFYGRHIWIFNFGLGFRA